MEELNNTMSQLELTDIYEILPSTTVEYILFLNAHWTFAKIDDI